MTQTINNVKKEFEYSESVDHIGSETVYPMCFHQLAKPNFLSEHMNTCGVGNCAECTYDPEKNRLCMDYTPYWQPVFSKSIDFKRMAEMEI